MNINQIAKELKISVGAVEAGLNYLGITAGDITDQDSLEVVAEDLRKFEGAGLAKRESFTSAPAVAVEKQPASMSGTIADSIAQYRADLDAIRGTLEQGVEHQAEREAAAMLEIVHSLPHRTIAKVNQQGGGVAYDSQQFRASASAEISQLFGLA